MAKVNSPEFTQIASHDSLGKLVMYPVRYCQWVEVKPWCPDQQYVSPDQRSVSEMSLNDQNGDLLVAQHHKPGLPVTLSFNTQVLTSLRQ